MSYLLNTAKGAISIRPASANNAEALRVLRLAALSTNPEAFAADFATAQHDPVERWAERIKSYALENTGVICLACAGEQLAGMAGIARGDHLKTRHSGWLWGVYTGPDWRGLQVGESLVKECLAWAHAQGLVVVKLGVVTTNTPAIRCYLRCGFSVFGVEPQSIFYDGVYYDELLMGKSV